MAKSRAFFKAPAHAIACERQHGIEIDVKYEHGRCQTRAVTSKATYLGQLYPCSLADNTENESSSASSSCSIRLAPGNRMRKIVISN